MSINRIRSFHKLYNTNNKKLWSYVNIAFNKVDLDRLKEVGPDRLCAEWIVKNGGSVKFHETKDIVHSKYNELPSDKLIFKLKEVDASEASIMKIGFAHFEGCDKLNKIKLHKCLHMENEALLELGNINEHLRYLEVSSCFNVVESGLLMLKKLTKLEHLLLYDFPYVTNLPIIIAKLKKDLPNCVINSS